MAQPGIRSILVATDLTEQTDAVVRAGADLARATGADLHVIHAFDLDRPPYMESVEPPSFRHRVDVAHEALTTQLRRSLPAGQAVSSREIVLFVAHKAIETRAEEVAADLVVVGPHRERGVADAFLGSTADRVVRTIEVPTLVVRGPWTLPLRSVLVPVDLSPPSLDALDEGARWAAAFGRQGTEDGRPALRVLHVAPLLEGSDEEEDLARKVAADVEREVAAALHRTRTSDQVRAVTELRRGEAPAGDIVSYAHEVDASLLVVGTHGYGAVVRALVGSVSWTVARRAARPVLLVPPAAWRRGSGG